MTFRENWDEILYYTVLFAVCLMVVGIIIGVVYESLSPTFTLSKSYWTCTAQHTNHTLVFMNNIPLTSDDTICDRYERKNK